MGFRADRPRQRAAFRKYEILRFPGTFFFCTLGVYAFFFNQSELFPERGGINDMFASVVSFAPPGLVASREVASVAGFARTLIYFETRASQAEAAQTSTAVA